MELVAPRARIAHRITASAYIRLVFVWTVVSTAIVCVVVTASGKPNTRAEVLMGTGLVLLWIVAGGLLMHRFRAPIRIAIQRIDCPWRVKFFVFCAVLALIEEAITTAMTNLAPLFGVPIGKAYITAPSNSPPTECGHSSTA